MEIINFNVVSIIYPLRKAYSYQPRDPFFLIHHDEDPVGSKTVTGLTNVLVWRLFRYSPFALLQSTGRTLSSKKKNTFDWVEMSQWKKTCVVTQGYEGHCISPKLSLPFLKEPSDLNMWQRAENCFQAPSSNTDMNHCASIELWHTLNELPELPV